MRQAIRRRAGMLLTHVVHVGARLLELESGERESRGIAAARLGHGHRSLLRHRLLQHILRHGGLPCIRRQFESEGFALLPITAADRLRKADFGYGRCVDLVRVLETRDSVRHVVINPRLCAQGAVPVVNHFDGRGVLGEIVGDTVLLRIVGGHAFRHLLTNRVFVGLACVVLCESQASQQRGVDRPHEFLTADRGERVRRRRLRSVARHRRAVLRLNDEPELAGVHRTAGERLADLHHALILRAGRVRVGERLAAVRGGHCLQLAVVIGDGIGHRMRMRVVGPAVLLQVLSGHAFGQLLAHLERVGVRHREHKLSEVDVGGAVLRDLGCLHSMIRPIRKRAIGLLDLDVLRITCTQRGVEGELARFGITPRHRLGYGQVLRIGVRRTVRVREFHALAAVRIGDRGDQVVLLVTRDGDLHVVGVDVVGHAVLRRIAAAHTFRHDFAHVVGEGLLVLPVECLVRELELTRPRAVDAHRDVRLERRPVGWVALVRRDHDIERAHHIVRLAAGVVGVVLDAPNRGHGLVLTHKGVREVGGFRFRFAFDVHAVVAEGVRQHGGRTHRAVTVVGHDHGGDVAGAGVLHARLATTLLGDHVLVRAGLGVGDRAECERDALPVLVCVRTTRVRHGHSPLFRHRRFGIGVTGRNLEREGLIGLPVALHKRLGTTD